MLDTVFIQGLVVDTIIGCYESEKHTKQRLRFDIEMAWDISRASESDSLADTLDYHAVTKRVERYLEENTVELVEVVAEDIATIIMKEFSVPGLRLRVAKPDALEQTVDVGVRISRGVEF